MMPTSIMVRSNAAIIGSMLRLHSCFTLWAHTIMVCSHGSMPPFSDLIRNGKVVLIYNHYKENGLVVKGEVGGGWAYHGGRDYTCRKTRQELDEI